MLKGKFKLLTANIQVLLSMDEIEMVNEKKYDMLRNLNEVKMMKVLDVSNE